MESGESAPLGRFVPQNARNRAIHADQQSAVSPHQRGQPPDAQPNFAPVRAHTGSDLRCRNHGQALNPQNEIGHASADATNEDPFPPVPINKRAFKQRRLISLREEKGLKNEIIVRRLKTTTSKAT